MSTRPIIGSITATALLVGALLVSACSNSQSAPTPPPEAVTDTSNAAAVQTPSTPAKQAPIAKRQGYEIVREIPHDTAAFTQGLFFHDGALFESTGRYGESQIRKLNPDNGDVLALTKLPDTVFGEGSARWGDKMIVLTWRSGAGFEIDLETLETVGGFSYPGEGWGLTASEDSLIQSNGSDQLLFLDPATYKIRKRIRVKLNGTALRNLNELEWIDGEIWANVWQADQIVRIDPESGHVLGVIDFTGLFPLSARDVPLDDVLNGIAYDAETERLFVTGKHWPRLFEVRITEPE